MESGNHPESATHQTVLQDFKLDGQRLSDHDTQKELDRKLLELDTEIKQKENLLSVLQQQSPQLAAKFADLKRDVSDTALAARKLMQQRQEEQSRHETEKRNLESLKSQFTREQQQRKALEQALQEIKTLLDDPDLSADEKEELEMKLKAAELAFSEQNEISQNLQKRRKSSVSQHHSAVTPETERRRILDHEKRLLSNRPNSRAPAS